MKIDWRLRTLLLLSGLAVFALAGGGRSVETAAASEDWPMWGGTPARNMVSSMKGLPSEWDTDSKKNIAWVADLGDHSYGNPVVAGGRVFVGTNNENPRDPKQTGDRGVLMAFKEATGEFLWQHTHAKLESGQANDWPLQGIASSPFVDGDRLYYVTNRGVVFCLGVEDARVIWSFDMIKELGVFPHNLANSSPTALGDLVFVGTSNGHDESHVKVPSPKAPSIVALDKTTGKLMWSDNSAGERILHGQWSPPAAGVIGGVAQVVSAQGDGWVRGFDVSTGAKLWEFDTNPKDAVWPKTRNELIATPVIAHDRVYIGNGQDPEHGEGLGNFYAIDATKRGDITVSGKVWQAENIRRTISTAAVVDGLVYIADFSGFLRCLDEKTGKEIWMHDLFAAVWGSPFVVDGKVYITDEDGDVAVMAHGREKKVIAETNMGSAVYGTITPANGAIFLNTQTKLFAIAAK